MTEKETRIEVDIPHRPEVLVFRSIEKYWLAAPELSGGKVFYPVNRYGHIRDYFTTRIKAQAACDKLNALIKKENKVKNAKQDEIIAFRDKEIAEWDKKYGTKEIK